MKHSISESGGFIEDVHKGREQEAPLISSFNVSCFKQDGKDLWVSDWQTLQSDVLKKHLYFISCCKLLSATQLFSCKHIPEIGKTQAVDYQLKHSEFLMKSLPACPLWVSACSITSAWCYREQRSLLAAACAVTAGSAACAQPPSAVPQIYAVLIVPGHSQMLSGSLFCKCARKENICLQVKSLRNLL